MPGLTESGAPFDEESLQVPFIAPELPDLKYEMNHFHSDESSGRTHIIRLMHIGVKIPTVIRRVLGSINKQPPPMLERFFFDSKAREMRVETINPQLTRFVVIHETRRFVDHPQMKDWCELHCRFRLYVLPSCGLLKATLAKWISQTWRGKQHQVSQAIDKKAAQLHQQRAVINMNATNVSGEVQRPRVVV